MWIYMCITSVCTAGTCRVSVCVYRDMCVSVAAIINTFSVYFHVYQRVLVLSSIRTLRKRSSEGSRAERLMWWTQGGCFLIRWPSRVRPASLVPGLFRDSFSFSNSSWRRFKHVYYCKYSDKQQEDEKEIVLTLWWGSLMEDRTSTTWDDQESK